MAVRKARWFLGSLALAGAAMLGSCILQWPLRAGSAAPPLDAQWLQGEPIDPQHPDGRIVVVETWATWCGPCIGSIPELDAVQRRYADRGVRVVAVAVMDDLAELQNFVARRGPSLSYAIAFDADGSVQQKWRPLWFGYYVPCTFVVDGSGRVETVTSPHALEAVLQRMLTRHEPRDDSTATRLSEDYWAARDAKDLAAVATIAAQATTELPDRAFPWAWRMRAAASGTERNSIAKQGFAAVRGDVAEIGKLASAAADLECLPAIAVEANAALANVSWLDGAFATSVARVQIAHTLGNDALTRAVDAAIASLATRPSDLAALARALLEPHADDGGRAREVPQELRAAALRLVEAALPTFAPWHVASLHYELLVETGAEAARLDAAGRRAVDSRRGSARELNSFAWSLLTDGRHLPATRGIALLAAEAMAEAPRGDAPDHLDTLALARFENGDIDGAIATQERAIAGVSEPNASFTERLERYRRARSVAAAPR